MATPTIAALRAASSNFASGPSGPQALNYAWMNTPGRALVMPVRSSPPPPKRSRPPDPSPPTDPPRSGPPGGRPPGSRPGDRGEPGGRYVDGGPGNRGDFGDRYMPDEPPRGGEMPQPFVSAPFEPPVTDMDLGLMEYIQPVPFAEAGPVEPQPPPQRGRDQFEFSPASMQDFGLMDFTPPASAVEVAPEPIPYMPQIVEPEAPPPAPVLQPNVPQESMDDMLMRYFMMQDMAEL